MKKGRAHWRTAGAGTLCRWRQDSARWASRAACVLGRPAVIAVFGVWCACNAAASLAANTDSLRPPGRVSAASEGMTRPYAYPPIDDAKSLKGAALVSALRKGGLVLFMRHAQTGTVTTQCTSSNLSSAGERDARFVGTSIRTLAIPIGRIESSPVCRVADTARLLGLGEPVLSPDLSNLPASPDVDLGAARAKRLAEAPPPTTNVIMVSHMQSGKLQSQWIHLDFAEIVVFRPDGKGGSDAIARIRADDWYDLMASVQK